MGAIKELNTDRGFGFIVAEDGKEYYFHRNVLIGIDFDHLVVGLLVSFGLENTIHGLRAVQVRVAHRL